MSDINELLTQYLPGEEGSKFKTVEDLAKAKAESDQFIERIKAENAEIRKQMSEYEANLQKAKGIDEVLDALKNMNASSERHESNDTSYHRSEDDGARNQPGASANDEGHVRQLIERTLNELNQKSTGERNWKEVNDVFLQKHNGDSEEAHVAMKYAAKEIGMTLDEFRSFAATKPQAALRATGMSQPQTRSNEPTRFAGKGGNESGNAGTGNQSQDGPRPKSYYDNLRNQLKAKGQASKYFSPEIQIRLHKDAAAMGDSWFDA
jgi:hypothetical protein